jgi:outer membrane protein OmpA-like peptidoglycan-associated protein
MPIILYQSTGKDPGEQNFDVGNGLDASATALSDVRIDARVVPFENDARTTRLGLGVAVWAATGNGGAYASDDGTTGFMYASAEHEFGGFLLSGMAGPHFRPYRSIGGASGELYIASELRWALGGYVPLRDGRIRLGVEFWGTTGLEPDVEGDNTFGRSRNTDIEWLAQARFLFGEQRKLYANFGAGTRLTAGYGAPDFRVLASLGYWFGLADEEPPSPSKRYEIVDDADDHEKDTDGDGYPDSIDRCPTVREDGLPPDPSDGCPAGADRDRDGIPDVEDACPDDPEDKDGVLDQDGCPEEDPDNDGIPDGEDRCPTQPGPRSDIAEKNGCPSLTRFEEGSEIQLLEPIQFDFAKATIKRVSFPILDEVVALMKARPDLMIAVHGHTDAVGSDAANLQLSKARAKSCMDYLVDHGIARRRLESEGFGESKPIDTNDTAAGRAKNRRVEFKVIE